VNRNDFFDRWSSLHGNTPVKGIVKVWISISYVLMYPLAKLRISPHLITLCGLIASIFTWLQSLRWFAPFILVLSLLADGVDGTLAMIQQKESKWGAIVDAAADRVSEAFWALTFYSLGAPMVVITIAWLAAGTQEYVRARMGGLGAKKVEVITIAERPVRASLLFIALISVHTQFNMINRTAWMWLVMQLVSFVLVFNDGYRRLK
jgi:phosphatidylglycerophosphate synthase